jgi:hypothetical protein
MCWQVIIFARSSAKVLSSTLQTTCTAPYRAIADNQPVPFGAPQFAREESSNRERGNGPSSERPDLLSIGVLWLGE